MKRTTIASAIAFTALLGTAGTAAADGVTAYLIDSGLLSPPVQPDNVQVVPQGMPADPAQAYLVASGLIEAPAVPQAERDLAVSPLPPEKRYLLEIDTTNYVEVIEQLPRS